ncbi:DUF6680 family protein [Shewanella sp. YLB-07]|uniref:DUF6680 family protein n=1 Tax=Shewanella sp. YLB-07 TaxID=2601268 RepID=UPI00128CAF32|nr:DUF6680 family protein [Shewanella sp. YLB-07]MPY21288.1 hypothetical protein [Shewanella sp. YLB-07]MPY22075.1 hypothetical protein [Shewanella sp. YLB-07]
MELNNLPELIAIVSSPLVAVLVTLWLNKKHQVRQDRLDIFKTLMMTRENNANMDYVKSVNSIDVVFYDRSKVREAWRNLYDAYHMSPPDLHKVQNSHTKLLEVMANELGYKDQITWEHITSSYSPKWLNNARENEAKAKELHLRLLETTLQQQVKAKDELQS